MRDDDQRRIKPNFFAAKDKGKGYYDSTNKNYKKHKTTMDHLQTCVNKYQRSRSQRPDKNVFLPLSSLIRADVAGEREQFYKVQRVLDLVDQMEDCIRNIYANEALSKQERSELAARERQACVEYMGNISFTTADMAYLLRSIEKPAYHKIAHRVFYILFGYPNVSFYSVIEQSSDGVFDIVPDPEGAIELYGARYEVTKKERYFVQVDE